MTSKSPGTDATLLPWLATALFRLLTVVAAAGAVYCLFQTAVLAARWHPIWLDAVRVEGTVVELEQTRWTTPDQRISRSTDMPVVEFRTEPSAEPVTFRARVAARRSRVGQHVPVIHAREDPGLARIDRGLLTWVDVYPYLVGLVVCALAALRLRKGAPSLDTLRER